MKKVLIVVDMQNDFIDEALGTKEAQLIVPAVIEKIKEYENSNNLIYYTKDTHFENYMDTIEGKYLPVPHCIKDTKGWMIPNEILRGHDDTVVEKYTFGSKELFDDLLDLYQEEPFVSIELVGLCTDICVVSNALLAKAYFTDIDIIVDSRACAGVSVESHNKALDTMKMCQIQILNEEKI